MERQRVYFNEYNVLMDNTIYLPLVSGLLQSYAKTIPAVQQNYYFMPFIFIRDDPDNIIKNYKNPAVAVFSVSMWNINLSLEVARMVKKKFPRCLIVFGGPSAPFNAESFFRLYPFIDLTARGGGEHAFVDILLRFLESKNFENILGISYSNHKAEVCIRNKEERQLPKNLDIYPSPYLEEAYEYLFEKDINFQAIIETNRGCPYRCSYCFWGQGGLSKLFRFFSLERIKRIIEWCGQHKIKYVFCADSNFGIFKRDLEIAHYFAEAKCNFGFPEKFRACCAKNAEDTVYEIGKLLHKYEMQKGVTL